MADRGFAAAAVHGDLGQGAREQALRAFRSGKIDVLVATDVAARGIDVQDVTHVINYQCPDDASTFLHRIGRTGRAGASGVAVTFVDWDDVPKWGLISKDLELGIPEPQETYSSSPHLFSDLGIPVGTKGTLPRSARVRAGLEAEEVEDLGETGRRRPAAKGRRPSRREGGRPVLGPRRRPVRRALRRSLRRPGHRSRGGGRRRRAGAAEADRRDPPPYARRRCRSGCRRHDGRGGCRLVLRRGRAVRGRCAPPAPSRRPGPRSRRRGQRAGGEHPRRPVAR